MNRLHTNLFLLLLTLLLAWPAMAQEDGEEPETDDSEQVEEDAAADEENDGDSDRERKESRRKPKSIAELTKNHDRHEGLFTLFRDRKTGATRMLLRKDQLDSEYIYWTQFANGVPDLGFFFRGAYGPSSVIEFRRHFGNIQLVKVNTAYYFDPENALHRAADANITDAVLAVEKILFEEKETGDILISVDKVFATEALSQIKPKPKSDKEEGKSFELGKLNDKKTRILGLRSYPENTDVEVEYVYSDPAPKVRGSAAVTDSRNVPLRVMHSFIKMPDDGYQPRFADPRLGTFDDKVTDLTSTSATPYRDLVRRWHLVKKEPGAALSEPVEPIVWWIENTTPVEWRALVRDAALGWNSAFEKAGFKNAVVVKVQPDDAEWDAGDIRYNVLRWTSSPKALFGGYGPSFSNPRTGQIIGADVMLEARFMTRHQNRKWLMEGGDPFAVMELDTAFGEQFCALGEGLQHNAVLAHTMNRFLNGGTFGDGFEEQIVRDTMFYLILHELGHTLGMNHNMMATHYLSPDEAFDPESTADGSLAGSVMDYPAVNYAPRGDEQTLFYSIAPGPYDDWFIEYVYSESIDDPQAEAARLETILARSTEPMLAFGNDADDMRAPGAGMDPRVNVYDMSNDAVTYASKRMGLVQAALDEADPASVSVGQSYQEIFNGVGAMLQEYGRAAIVTSRYVGGVYVDRAMSGQAGATEPYRPVPEDKQKQAMRVLREQVFAPGVFQVPENILRHAAVQRRGFQHMGKTQDPKLHDGILDMHKAVLNHLLHPVVLKRITDTELYGNTYTLAEMMGDLTDAIFADDARGNVNTRRQNLQMAYVRRLAGMMDQDGKKDYHTPARSLAVYNLGEIRDLLAGKRGGIDIATRAHVQNLSLMIDRALSTDA